MPGLGLDVEPVGVPAFAADDALGPLAYSAAERAWVAGLPEERRARARALLWTRKEALVKARGTGFTTDPAEVDALGMPTGIGLTDLPSGLVAGIDDGGVDDGGHVGALAWAPSVSRGRRGARDA